MLRLWRDERRAEERTYDTRGERRMSMDLPKPRISIIVPVYKVEEYIDRCVQSLVDQTMLSLEILLVDDGSPDRCPEICDEWARRDTRVCVIHKENGGLSDARNAGIAAAQGEYFLFVDSDDYLATDACQVLLDAAEHQGADLVCCNFFLDFGSYKKLREMPLEWRSKSLSGVEGLELFLREQEIWLIVAWNKLCHRKLFFSEEQIRFPVGRLHEDEFTSYRLLYASENTVFVENPLYYYVQREGSIMSHLSERNVYDRIACAYEYIPWVQNAAPQLLPQAEQATVRAYLGLYAQCRRTSLDPDVPVMQDFLRFIRQNTKCLLYRSGVSWKMKLKDTLLRLHLYPLCFSVGEMARKSIVFALNFIRKGD